MANQQVVVVKFKDGKHLYGVWSLWRRSLSAPLFVHHADAEAHLKCGISSMVDIEAAVMSAEDVEVYLLDVDAHLFRTQASWKHAYVTGPCEAAVERPDREIAAISETEGLLFLRPVIMKGA